MFRSSSCRQASNSWIHLAWFTLRRGHTNHAAFRPIRRCGDLRADLSQPLGQPDLEFIEQLLGVTSNLFFIQTKISTNTSREDWQQILQRNQDLLGRALWATVVFHRVLADLSLATC